MIAIDITASETVSLLRGIWGSFSGRLGIGLLCWNGDLSLFCYRVIDLFLCHASSACPGSNPGGPTLPFTRLHSIRFHLLVLAFLSRLGNLHDGKSQDSKPDPYFVDRHREPMQVPR